MHEPDGFGTEVEATSRAPRRSPPLVVAVRAENGEGAERGFGGRRQEQHRCDAVFVCYEDVVLCRGRGSARSLRCCRQVQLHSQEIHTKSCFEEFGGISSKLPRSMFDVTVF